MFTGVLLLTSIVNAGTPQFLDANFTGDLCQVWNSTKLPTLLGRDGSAWIDSAGSKGSQRMVISRRDCTNFSKVQLIIEADGAGKAMCASGGTYDGAKFQWKFEPTTSQWADFTDGFGMLKMPGIMPGFVGPYPTAAANIKSFEVFFAATGKLALDSKVGWSCTGGDTQDINDEIEDIDKADMTKILR